MVAESRDMAIDMTETTKNVSRQGFEVKTVTVNILVFTAVFEEFFRIFVDVSGDLTAIFRTKTFLAIWLEIFGDNPRKIPTH